MLCLQRYAESSLFKRTIYQHIAEDLLAGSPAVSPAVSCALDSRARPVVTMPTDSPLQSLLTSLSFEEDDVVDRHKVSAGLQLLGTASASVPWSTSCQKSLTHGLQAGFQALALSQLIDQPCLSVQGADCL